MKVRMVPWLAMCVLFGLAPVRSIHAGKDDGKLKNAIRHRCVLECVWAGDRCDAKSKPECEAATKTCTAGCMAPGAIQGAVESRPPEGWGTTIQQAIEVCLPSGERYFLDDLRCLDGKAPEYERSASVGPRNPFPDDAEFDPHMLDPTYTLKKGETDHHIIDKYVVRCAGKEHVLYFDMYHCGTPKPWVAPRGFSRPPRG